METSFSLGSLCQLCLQILDVLLELLGLVSQILSRGSLLLPHKFNLLHMSVLQVVYLLFVRLLAHFQLLSVSVLQGSQLLFVVERLITLFLRKLIYLGVHHIHVVPFSLLALGYLLSQCCLSCRFFLDLALQLRVLVLQ